MTEKWIEEFDQLYDQIIEMNADGGGEHTRRILKSFITRKQQELVNSILEDMVKITYDLSLDTHIHSRDLMTLVKHKLKEKYV